MTNAIWIDAARRSGFRRGIRIRSAKPWDPIRGPANGSSYRWCRKRRSTTGYKRRSLRDQRRVASGFKLALMGRWPGLAIDQAFSLPGNVETPGAGLPAAEAGLGRPKRRQAALHIGSTRLRIAIFPCYYDSTIPMIETFAFTDIVG